jgi:tyrosinase
MNSPYMDGSPYSQGGNGVWSPHNCTKPQPSGNYCTPVIEGEGGGCVTTGPYAGIMTNITSTRPTLNATDGPIPGKILSYEPRCIRRDISADLSQRFAGDEHLLRLLTHPTFQVDNIGPFQKFFEGGTATFPPGNEVFDIGLHGAGHYVFAGDPGGDV